jgi:hypothetical protein
MKIQDDFPVKTQFLRYHGFSIATCDPQRGDTQPLLHAPLVVQGALGLLRLPCGFLGPETDELPKHKIRGVPCPQIQLHLNAAGTVI